MKLNKLIEDLSTALVVEAPQVSFETSTIPPGFEFLENGYVDLGFEDLNLSKNSERSLSSALITTGVIVPETKYKLRQIELLNVMIESMDGTEKAVLPKNWKTTVTVHPHEGDPTWIGKAVRKDRYGGINIARDYVDAGDGWVRK